MTDPSGTNSSDDILETGIAADIEDESANDEAHLWGINPFVQHIDPEVETARLRQGRPRSRTQRVERVRAGLSSSEDLWEIPQNTARALERAEQTKRSTAWLIHKAVMDRLPSIDASDDVDIEPSTTYRNRFRGVFAHTTPHLILMQVARWLEENIASIEERNTETGRAEIVFERVERSAATGVIPDHDFAVTVEHQQSGDLLYAAVSAYMGVIVAPDNVHALFRREDSVPEAFTNILPWYLTATTRYTAPHQLLWNAIAASVQISDVNHPLQVIHDNAIWYSSTRFMCHPEIQKVMNEVAGANAVLQHVFDSEETFKEALAKHRQQFVSLVSLTAQVSIPRRVNPFGSTGSDKVSFGDNSTIFMSSPLGQTSLDQAVIKQSLCLARLTECLSPRPESRLTRRVQARQVRRPARPYQPFWSPLWY